MEQLFEEITRQIAIAYQRFEYKLGWSFLYGPRHTLVSRPRFLFMGINPAGNEENVTPCVEEGNSYLIENWKDSKLKKRVQRLFQELHRSTGKGGDWKEFAHQLLTTNFCPFRSPRWKQLPRRDEAVRFSNQMWQQILEKMTPGCIICMGAPAWDNMKEVLAELKYVQTSEEGFDTNWGNIRFMLTAYKQLAENINLAYFPHLSEYNLFSDEKYRKPLREFTHVMVERTPDM